MILKLGVFDIVIVLPDIGFIGVLEYGSIGVMEKINTRASSRIW